MLDRLIKDIVSDFATSYVSVLHDSEHAIDDDDSINKKGVITQPPTAFSLPQFIPLLQERIHVLNPFSRMFLVGWLRLLDSLPDLELVSFLPSFLAGLFQFLNDSNQDVVNATQHCLERFLDEIKLVAHVKRDLGRNRQGHLDDRVETLTLTAIGNATAFIYAKQNDDEVPRPERIGDEDAESNKSGSESENEDAVSTTQEDWVPGQDVHIDHPKLLEILVTFLGEPSGTLSKIYLGHL